MAAPTGKKGILNFFNPTTSPSPGHAGAKRKNEDEEKNLNNQDNLKSKKKTYDAKRHVDKKEKKEKGVQWDSK